MSAFDEDSNPRSLSGQIVKTINTAITSMLSRILTTTSTGKSAANVLDSSVNAGDDQNRNVTVMERRLTYGYLSGIATTVVSNNEAVLGVINITNPTATSVINVYDGLTTGATQIASIDGSVVGSYTFDVLCSTGITIDIVTATCDLTVGFK